MTLFSKFSNQLLLAVLLGVLTFLSIVGQTFTLLLSALFIYCFMGFAALSLKAITAERKPVRMLGVVGTVIFALVILGTLLNALERGYLVNGDSYPTFLGTDIGRVNLTKFINLTETECKGMGAGSYAKANGIVVIRCGNSWFSGKTFIGHTTTPDDLSKEDVK
ncbi:hypothetical protein [Yersinia enterocolitica]|uniref:hypothetical protein n=1 Tax=Yersinia enterocolitica TaxID=630 RepID=UPI003D088D00